MRREKSADLSNMTRASKNKGNTRQAEFRETGLEKERKKNRRTPNISLQRTEKKLHAMI